MRQIKENILNKMLDVLGNISDGCCLYNSNMEVEFINKAGEVIINKSKEELLHKYAWEVFSIYKNTIVYEYFMKALQQKEVQIFEMISQQTGNPLQVKVFPYEDGLLVLFSDISERKKNEKRQKYYDQLKIIGEVSAGVAHEVRNPMTTIKGFMQLLLQNEDLLKYEGVFRLIIDEVNRVNEIITNFLDLAKEKPCKLEWYNLNDIVLILYPLLEARALKEGKCIILQLGHIPNLMIDKNEIRQLLLNLVNNSLDAMNEGKSVYIRTFMRSGQVILAIQDEGEGIPKHIQDRISLPFVTSKDNGTGLGLPICFSIAKRNNAEICYESTTDGTTFEISFLAD